MAQTFFGPEPAGLEDALPFGDEPSIGGGGTGATAEQIWSFVLPNGKTTAQTLVEVHTMLQALTTTTIADAVWSKELP